MNTEKIKEVCRLACEFAMKTSITAPSHVNGHTYLDKLQGHVSVGAFWDVAIDQVKVNICFLETGNSYTYWISRDKVQDANRNDVHLLGIELLGIQSVLTTVLDDQNALIATARLNDTGRVGAIPA